MKKDIFKNEESMNEYLENQEKEYNAHYEENVLEKKEDVKKSKVDKLFINVQKVIATLQVGFFLAATGTGVYAISKAKKDGETLPKTLYSEKDYFKMEDDELVIPTIHGNIARIKIR